MDDGNTLIRVCYADTDAGGVVYHGSYLRYFDQARADWLRHRGFSQQVVKEQMGLVFAVRAVQLRYCRPAGLDAQLVIRTQVNESDPTTLRFRQEAWCEQVLLVEGDVELVCVDLRRWKAAPWPEAIRSTIAAQSAS
ncbi:YbgC/FadM family acyl-CoA thioesterase [Dyella subtropica]|uniref:YbgC/FadM family acyl-CoA thioesterase n=1 Tax=Dyella subtropica TaxID=2992127 RepID=UPI0022552449|nr:YbgC/FadM family acyl-CoA thioesterase [Dyella subtropica]